MIIKGNHWGKYIMYISDYNIVSVPKVVFKLGQGDVWICFTKSKFKRFYMIIPKEYIYLSLQTYCFNVQTIYSMVLNTKNKSLL